MKTCATPSCSTRPVVSLYAAMRAGWRFMTGRIYCAACAAARGRS